MVYRDKFTSLNLLKDEIRELFLVYICFDYSFVSSKQGVEINRLI